MYIYIYICDLQFNGYPATDYLGIIEEDFQPPCSLILLGIELDANDVQQFHIVTDQ